MFSIEVEDGTNSKGLCCAGCASCCIDITPSIEDLVMLQEYELEEILDFEKNDLFFRNVNGQCLFLKGTLCSIYDKRPYICKPYPFKVEPCQLIEDKILFKLTCGVSIRDGIEYTSCYGGLTGMSYFVNNGNILPIAQDYAASALREFVAHSLIETSQDLITSKNTDEAKKYKLNYIERIMKLYRDIDINDAAEILGMKHGEDSLEALSDWFKT